MAGFEVRQVHGLGAVVAGLAADLARPRVDPFAADVVCVDSQGQRRWLAQQLSLVLGAHGSVGGVCTGIDFPTVWSLVRRTCDEITGRRDGDDPWSSERLVWPILRAFDVAEGQAWFEPVSRHLAGGDEARPGRRFATASRMAQVFQRYGRWRPALLDSTEGWQGPLWHLAREFVDGRPPWEEIDDVCARLVARPKSSALPDRLHVVAPVRLAPPERMLLKALGAGRDVTAWWPVASAQASQQESPSSTVSARWGGASRAALRFAVDVADSVTVVAAEARNVGTALAAVQARVRHDAPVEFTPRPDDRSIQVHLSHGPARQVEVLRDVVCSILANDPSLEPRDILVVTPDLATYGPLVRAMCMMNPDEVGSSLHPVTGLRVRVADRSLRQPNPVLEVMARLLRLASGRAGRTELLALLGSPPVARRFGLSKEDLDVLTELTQRAGIRWGIDGDGRRRFGLESVRQNTWLAGLQRLVLGVALSEEQLPSVGTVLPLDEVESSDLDRIGALAEMISLVRSAVADFDRPASRGAWADRLRGALEPLVAVRAEDGWQMGQALTLIAGMESEDDPTHLSLGDVSEHVESWLEGITPRPALLTGTLSVTSMEALRHVPHEVVVVLGIDEAQFPRRQRFDGDDLLLADRDPADPDPPADDRQLFLDSLLAARSAFVVIAASRDSRTNDPLPLAAPVVDLIEAAAELGGPDILVRHALHAVEPGGELTYSRASVRARRTAATARATGVLPRLDLFASDSTQPADAAWPTTIAELSQFLRHPIRGYLTARVGSWAGIDQRPLRSEEDTLTDEIPIQLNGLERWAVADRLVRLRVAGHAPASAEAAEWRRGDLPPQSLGRARLDEAHAIAERVFETAGPYLVGPDMHVEHTVDLPSGRRLTGRVTLRNGLLVSVTASAADGARLLDPWLGALLLAAAGGPGRAVVCGRRGAVRLEAPDPSTSAAVLDTVVDLVHQGRMQPLPLPIGLALYTLRSDGRATDEDVERRWRYERDSTWSLYFETPGELNSGAGRWGGFAALASTAYGSLVRAEMS